MAQQSVTQRQVSGIPQVGYGTWNRPGEQAYRGVLWALEAGYRHIDTAQGYGNEAEVGRALRDSGLPRSEVFVTTKVAPENYGPGQVMQSSRASLEKLGLDQVDLLLLHWPSPHDEYLLEAYVPQLAQVFDAGLARRIGVSNFTIRQIDAAQKLLGERRIATNQVELHVFMQNRPIVAHCQKIGVPITAYSPLARGAVAKDPVLADMATRHGATPAQVALAFLLARGHIVIPSSGDRQRITSNWEAQRLELTPEEIAQFEALDRGMRLVNGPWTPKWDE